MLLVALLLGPAVVARAEAPAESKAEAMKLAAEGATAYSAGRFSTALARFEAAYQAYPAPALALDLARAELKLGHCDKAIAYAIAYGETAGPAERASQGSPEAALATMKAGCVDTKAVARLAILPLEIAPTVGKHLTAEDKARLDQLVAGAAQRVLQPGGWSVLAGDELHQKEAAAGVNAAKCHTDACRAETVDSLVATAFLSMSMQWTAAGLSAELRVVDTKTVEPLATLAVRGATAAVLLTELESKARSLLEQAAMPDGIPVADSTGGELYLKVEPPGATYEIDGSDPKKLLTSRLTILKLPIGKHRVILHKNGYQDRRADPVINRGRATTLTATLLARLPPVARKGTSSLALDSTPPRAHIFLDGQDTTLLTPNTFTGLGAGEHQVVLVLDDFVESQSSVRVAAGEAKSVNVTLAPNFGALAVVTDPPGAIVLVDGRRMPQATPLDVGHFEAKACRVEISLEKYAPVTWTVAIEPGATVTLRVSLDPTFGTLQLQPKPAGATAFVDDAQLPGVTPLTQPVDPGTHKVRFSAAGYADVETTTQVASGQTAVVAPQLKLTSGSLVVNATGLGGKPVADAEVKIAGTLRGKTPLTLEPLAAGEYDVQVSAALHHPWSGHVTVVGGEQAHVTAGLAPEYGFVRATSKPAGTLKIDDTVAGPADGTTYPAAMGARRLSIEPAEPNHYRPSEMKADISVGKTVTFDATLVPRLGNASVASTPPGAAVELDGKHVGQTPVALTALLAGDHALTLTLDGYLHARPKLSVTEGKTEEVSVTLMSAAVARAQNQVRQQKILGATVAGVSTGVVAIGAAVCLYLAHQYSANEATSLAQYNAATDSVTASTARASTSAALSSATATQIVSAVGAALAAAGLGVTIYEVVTMPPAVPRE